MAEVLPEKTEEEFIAPSGRENKTAVVMHLHERILFAFGALGKWLRRRWVFSSVVLLPTLLVACYLWIVATPQYISETHFLVRGKSFDAPSAGGLSSLLDSSHGGSQDTYAVQDYMMSRDALEMLIDKAHIKDIYNASNADFIAKFPSFFRRGDFESFYSYYCSHVKARIDEETGISHLSVRTFSPEGSQLIVKTLLEAGEKLVNDMNERQRHNTLYAARSELSMSLKELHDTEMQLASYRYTNAIIDPVKQVMPMVGTTLSLETTLAMMEAEKKQLDMTAPNSPLRKVYAQRIASIRAQVQRAQSHITGKEDTSSSLVPKLLGYDELEIKRKIIERKIAEETTALEAAKAQADKQMLFITVIAKPSLPDYAGYPKRLVFLLIAFSSFLGIYITGSLLVSGAREHALQ